MLSSNPNNINWPKYKVFKNGERRKQNRLYQGD